MNLRLDNKVVLVAGSSRGIGYAVAQSFLREGARVVITGRDAAALRKAERDLAAKATDRVLAIRADLSKRSAIQKVVGAVLRRWERIDCLVANVGTGAAKPGWNVTEEDWSSAFASNLWSSIALIETVLRKMVKQGSGSVVLISSITALEALGAPVTYSTAKAALAAYGKNLSRQVAGLGIRVNCVAPGNILFPGGRWEKRLKERASAVREMLEREVPLKRFGRPEEIADVVTFLASERASFMTGACVVADGGQTRSY